MTEKASKKAPKPKTEKKPATIETKEQKPKNKGGRPSLYNQEIAARICDLIATSDKGLERLVLEYPELPDPNTIRMWCWRHEEFRAQYMRAREAQQLWMADKAVQIAADGRNDVFVDDDGKVRVDTDVIQRSRLLVDTIKWQASKLAPKQFGEKVDVNHGGQAGNPVTMLYEQLAGTPFKPKSSN